MSRLINTFATNLNVIAMKEITKLRQLLLNKRILAD